MVQTPTVDPPRVDMVSSMAPESRNQTPEQTKQWRALKKKPTCGDPMA